MSGHMVADDEERTYAYSDGTLLTRMVKYLLVYRGMFIAVSLLVAMSIALSTWLPFVLQHAIDVDFPSGNLN
ncbi:MAG: hypothetical protein ACFFER_19710, partial [Candidatus Thorarchaeota archaeon]